MLYFQTFDFLFSIDRNWSLVSSYPRTQKILLACRLRKKTEILLAVLPTPNRQNK